MRIGAIVTVGWVSVMAVLLWRLYPSGGMTPNELGDFFSGVFAPVAFLWLVLGYLQQGDELRQNTEALLAQQREMEEQVIQTRILAENAKRQADAAEVQAKEIIEQSRASALSVLRDCEPILRVVGSKGDNGQLRSFSILNAGTAPIFSLTSDENSRIYPSDVIKPEQEFKVVLTPARSMSGNIEVSVTCDDKIGNRYYCEICRLAAGEVSIECERTPPINYQVRTDGE